MDDVPAARVQRGLFLVMRLPPRGHPSAARAQLRCLVPFPMDLFSRGDRASTHTQGMRYCSLHVSLGGISITKFKRSV